MKKKKKQAFTLLEIMMVIFIIGLVAGIVGYNMKGSLDKAKVFKTQQGIEKVRDILLLEISAGDATVAEAVEHPADVLRRSKLVKNPDELIKDGWGEKLVVEADNDEIIKVYSKKMSNANAQTEPKGL